MASSADATAAAMVLLCMDEPPQGWEVDCIPPGASAVPRASVGAPPVVNSTTRRRRSGLQPVAGLENPGYQAEADDEEQPRHRQAYADVHVGDLVEAPAEATHEIHHGVEERHGLPRRRQDVDRVESAAEEGERCYEEERHELQLLEAVRPDADDEAEQAEGPGGEEQEGHHPARMRDTQRHEERGGDEDDDA